MVLNRPVLSVMLAVSASALVLTACEQTAPAADPPAPPAATEPATLAGVDLTHPLRALGTEPFWGVDITGAGLVYSGVDRPRQIALHDGPVIQEGVAVWSGRTEQGVDLEVTLAASRCSDGMSDRVYPLSARVRVGDETLTGCAASALAIMTAGESGPVVEPPQ